MSMLHVHVIAAFHFNVAFHVNAAFHINAAFYVNALCPCLCTCTYTCRNAGMPDCPASGQSGTGLKKLTMPEQVQYRTKIRDAGMPMPALVSSMPMPSSASIQELTLDSKGSPPCLCLPGTNSWQHFKKATGCLSLQYMSFNILCSTPRILCYKSPVFESLENFSRTCTVKCSER
jgi:hypothetical protein